MHHRYPAGEKNRRRGTAEKGYKNPGSREEIVVEPDGR
jgi:hypothetical protein